MGASWEWSAAARRLAPRYRRMVDQPIGFAGRCHRIRAQIAIGGPHQPPSLIFIALKAAASSSGGVLAFSCDQAPANSALAVSRSWDEPIGRPPVRWILTIQSQIGGVRSLQNGSGRCAGGLRVPNSHECRSSAASAFSSPPWLVAVVRGWHELPPLFSVIS